MDDLISRAAPPGDEVYLHPRSEGIEFSKYALVQRLDAGTTDECYLAASRGMTDIEKHLFLRRFDRTLLEPARIEALHEHAYIDRPDVAQLYELGSVDDRWGFVVSEFITGASLVELSRRGSISWLAATALAHDVLSHLRSLHELGVDGAITPARVRIAKRGRVMLCLGLPGLDQRSYHRISCDLLDAIFGLATTPAERAMLRGLFADDSPDAIWVVSDALVERHRELDPVLPLVLLAHAGRIDPAEPRAALEECVSRAELTPLWDLVCAPATVGNVLI